MNYFNFALSLYRAVKWLSQSQNQIIYISHHKRTIITIFSQTRTDGTHEVIYPF